MRSTFAILLVATVAMPSCGANPNSSHFASSTHRAPVVAVMAGYGTCGLFGDPSHAPITAQGFLPMLRRYQARTAEVVPYVISCFNGFLGDKIRFKASAHQRIQQVDWNDSANLVSEIEAMVLENPQAPLILIGHSYGGWIAMQAADILIRKLQETGDTRPISLVTIDPISPVKCAQAGAILGSVISAAGFRTYPGCDSWPDDLPVNILGENLSVWKNFYQETFRPLHSSQIPLAENFLVPLVSSRRFGGAHTDLSMDNVPWSEIEQIFDR